MAYRKTYVKAQRQIRSSNVLPIWTSKQSEVVTLAFQALLSRIGIVDTASYFRQLRFPIAISVVACACVGGVAYGIKGLVLGGLAGLLAPAALVYLVVLLLGIAIYLAVFFAAWAVIWAIAKWFLSEFFRF